MNSLMLLLFHIWHCRLHLLCARGQLSTHGGRKCVLGIGHRSAHWHGMCKAGKLLKSKRFLQKVRLRFNQDFHVSTPYLPDVQVDLEQAASKTDVGLGNRQIQH